MHTASGARIAKSTRAERSEEGKFLSDKAQDGVELSEASHRERQHLLLSGQKLSFHSAIFARCDCLGKFLTVGCRSKPFTRAIRARMSSVLANPRTLFGEITTEQSCLRGHTPDRRRTMCREILVFSLRHVSPPDELIVELISAMLRASSSSSPHSLEAGNVICFVNSHRIHPWKGLFSALNAR